MTYFKKFILSYVFYGLAALGISLTIKAGIGVSSFNAMNLAIAQGMDMKIGIITIAFNSFFLCLYMLLTDFQHKKMYLLQALSFLMFGNLINLFTYNVLMGFQISAYSLKILVLILGISLSGISIGFIIRYGIITFPLESLCMVLSDKSPLSFLQLRYGVDVISIAISLLVSTTASLPVFVREGTLISFVLFTLMMNLTKSPRRHRKWATS